MDGAPGLEVVLGTASALSIVNGANGNVIGSSDPLGTWIMRSECVGVDLDANPGQELVCLLDSSLTPATNQRRAFALRYNGAAAPALELLWSTALASDDGELTWRDPVADLDADGLMELVASGKAADGTWTTTVLAAESGAVLATIPNAITRGVANTVPGGELVLITAMDTSLAGWRFQRAGQPGASPLWAIPDVDLLGFQDLARRAQTRISARALTVDVDGYGRQDLITMTTAAPQKVVAYSTSSATPAVVGEFVLPNDLELVSAWPTASAIGLGRLAVLQNDGIVRVLEARLLAMESPDDVVAPGLRFGGYHLAGGWRDLQSTMVVGTLSPGQPHSIIARDSRGALVRLDAAHGSFAAPPRTEWTRTRSFSPAIVGNLVGNQPGVACFATKQPVTADPEQLLEVLSADGTPVWSVDVPKRPFNDILPGAFSAPGARDLVFEWGDPGDTQVRKRAVSGTTGATIWDSAALEAGSGRQPAGMAVGDWDGDGLDDVFHQATSTRVISGADGQELVNTGAGPSYFQPLLANLDDDPANEVILQGGVTPAQAYDDDLSTLLWTSSESDRPVPYGSLITCPDGRKIFIEGSWLNAARLRVTTLSGADVGIESTIVLAGGAAYADEAAAIAAGKSLSQLGSIAAHSDLRGAGQPIAMVGSGDGWLYGYEPCTGSLEIVYDAGAPVGAPIFGDTDGDGKDEILISTADGYLYALRNLTLAAPGYVWDIDPDAGITDRDVNAVVTRDSLSARWRDVPGATSYEVTVVNLDEQYISTPFWTDVGLVTQTTLTGLPLQHDAAYRFAVRAIAADGRSVDTVSNGVVVRFPDEVGDGDAGPDAGPPTSATGGCGCSSDTSASSKAGFALLLLLVAGRLRRRVR
jgi:MYXO-CTERM domain-containing protein